MGQSHVQLPPNSTGEKLRGYRRGAAGTDPIDQYVIPTTDRVVSFTGSGATFRTPGRAGTAGQKLFVIHNATASPVLVAVTAIKVDLAMTAAKTVLPPLIRLHRTALPPAGGTAVPKVAKDTNDLSSGSVTALGDASADGTSTAVGLTVTIPTNNIIGQQFAPRNLTMVGYEQPAVTRFLQDGEAVLRANQGLAVELVYTAATQNPTTDMWTVVAHWQEFTQP